MQQHFQIDVHIIVSMSEQQLKDIGLVKFGDRVAVTMFCHKAIKTTVSSAEKPTNHVEEIKSKLSNFLSKKSSMRSVDYLRGLRESGIRRNGIRQIGIRRIGIKAKQD